MHAVAGGRSKLCNVAEDSPVPPPAPKIDTTLPHSARIWNYWLGGKDNYPVDREAGDRYRAIYPQIVDTARAGRYFLARTVRYLAGEAEIRQFLDVGTGLPTVDNTHEVAQRVAPESRIVYVDNDPLVLAHARALLTSSAEGACDYIDADMRDPEAIRTAAAGTLDLTQPVALLLIGVMGHISDYDQAHGIVASLLGGLPAGSYLALADSISSGQAHREAGKQYAQTGAVPYQLRTHEQIKGFFAGLTLVDPGVVSITDWRPDPSPFPPPRVETLGGIGRKELQAGDPAVRPGAVGVVAGLARVRAPARDKHETWIDQGPPVEQLQDGLPAARNEREAPSFRHLRADPRPLRVQVAGAV